MKVVIVIDSFKGSLDSLEAGNAIKEGILAIFPNAEVIIKPIADGGEGTVEALTTGLQGSSRKVKVCGPLKTSVIADYGIIQDGQVAIIEMAKAAGLPHVNEAHRNPLYTSSYGVGELILDALSQGCHSFIIGLGGSATNDGGIGMLSALGIKFYDKDDNQIEADGQGLDKITRISTDDMPTEIYDCTFQIASDVTNPLLGPIGATYIFGPQKGATKEIADILENGMKNYAQVTTEFLRKDYTNLPGAGAAGGLGFAFAAFLGATIESGVSTILDLIQCEKDFLDADYVITGEGKLDKQTAMGKAPIGVATLAKKHDIPVIAFSGCADKDADVLNLKGIDAFFPILQSPMSFKEAMDKEMTRSNLTATAKQVFSLIATLEKKEEFK